MAAEVKTAKVQATGKTQAAAQTQYLVRSILSPDRGLLAKSMPASYATYRLVRLNPTVALARALTIAPVVSAEWAVEADDDVDDSWVRFIQDNLSTIREPLIKVAMEGRVDFGWAAWEKVFVIRPWEGTQRTMLHRLKPLLHDLTDIMIDDTSGAFLGFYQGPSVQADGKELKLELPYSFLVSFDAEGDNLYGRPLLENVRRTYTNWEDAGAGAERYDRKVAGTHWVIHHPMGSSVVDGENVDNGTLAATILGSLQASGSVSVPRKVVAYIEDLDRKVEGDAWKIELIDHPAKQGSFVERMNYCDKQFVRGLLWPERAILEGEHGTKAEAGVHASLSMLQRDLEHRHITRHVNWHIVDQLLALNFGEDARGKVRLVAAPLADAKLAFFQAVYQAVLAHPVASMDAIDGLDLDALMDAAGLPKAAEVIPQRGEPAAGGGPFAGLGLRQQLFKRITALYGEGLGGNGDGTPKGE